MYIGNGMTKRFPLPDGYDGSVVILKIPSGKGILMKAGDGYKIENGNVVFSVAVPAGVEVCFNESEADIITNSPKNYVIIRSDGTIQEVSEDPALILAEAKEMLTASEKRAAEIEQAITEAKTYIAETVSASHGDLDGRLDGYAQVAGEIANEAALNTKAAIMGEMAEEFETLKAERGKIREEISDAERLKDEMKSLVSTALDTTKAAISEECTEAIAACREMKGLKNEIAIKIMDAQTVLRDMARESVEECKTNLNEEFEYLRNLRIKLEENFNMLNAKITNRWEIFEERLRNG